MDDDNQISRINMHLESISYWSSIYETGASSELVELQDQLYDLLLELQAAAAVLPVLRQETQPQDVVALEQSGAGPLRAISSLPVKSDDFGNETVPRLQQLMRMLSSPISPEQLDEIVPILKNIPPLIDEFLKKRRAITRQQRQILRRQLKQQQQLKQEQSGMAGIDGQLPGQPGLRDDPENPGVRKLSIRRCLQQMAHAYRCNDTSCRLTICQSMKKVAHIKNCKKRINGDCPICKQEMQHLSRALMNSKTREEQNQILQIFKNKPHLVADAIKDRENFDFCVSWLIGFDLGDESSPADANQVNTQGAQSSSLTQRCTRHEVHDFQFNRELESSQIMNNMVEHVKRCKKLTTSYCSPCKRLRNFYGHHALLCQVPDNECPMPFCHNVKQRLKELPECRKSLQIRLLRRNRYLWSTS